MLARLVLTDYRNHAGLTLTPGAGLVVLTGDNGAGKTNVLEAVSLLAPGRGLRRARLGEIARADGPGGFGVAATLSDQVAIATGTLPQAPERRVLRIQGVPAATASLAERLAVLWLTPAMDRLFVEAAGGRRRFLDRLVLALAPGHAAHAQRYDAAMRDRNRLLAEPRPDTAWLAALEAQMAEHGAAIAAARVETVALLAGHLAAQPPGPFARAGLTLAGWGGDPSALADDLRRGRARDTAAGRTLAGPHRDDLLVANLDKPAPGGGEGGQPAAMASTGEQKALLLGIVLAHADLVAERAGARPVLLLDEIAAHLDPVRRTALFDRLAGGGQCWLTGTEEALFAGIGGDATRLRLA